jgi:[phosphatase 2A protein]-leucine-carboxy methyltransferase
LAASQHDATIQGTDTDAAVSRLSAVELGYLDDPFARLFVQAPPPGPGGRRLPIINRGTYTRTTAIDALVDRFLATTNPEEVRQIVSLGAGTDTRCFRLFSSQHRNVAYHEIDFPAITARKQAIIRSSPQLQVLLSAPEPLSPTTWQSRAVNPDSNNTLTLHGLDLRHFPPSPPSESQAYQHPLPTFNPFAPTLVLSECCLCYLAPATASSILEFFTTTATPTSTTTSSPSPSPPSLGVVIYEPIQPHDAFGRMMVSNLAARGISMPTLEAYPTEADQQARLRGAGFDEVRCRTVDSIWDKWVSAREKERVDRLEGGLDEVEEWRLLAGHYVVAWGWRTGGGGMDLEVDGQGEVGRDGDGDGDGEEG